MKTKNENNIIWVDSTRDEIYIEATDLHVFGFLQSRLKNYIGPAKKTENYYQVFNRYGKAIQHVEIILPKGIIKFPYRAAMIEK